MSRSKINVEEILERDALVRATGARVRARREASEMTQRELRDALGWSTSYLSNLERGNITQPPSMLRLFRIARAMECEIADLVPTIAEVGL